jgi:hypothetical protein
MIEPLGSIGGRIGPSASGGESGVVLLGVGGSETDPLKFDPFEPLGQFERCGSVPQQFAITAGDHRQAVADQARRAAA